MNIQNNDDNIFDAQGYRYNVGIVILNQQNKVFWGRRRGQNAWQFPQGGINAAESGEQAMLRELWEETGLQGHHVDILGFTQQWLRYRLPLRFRRHRRAGMVQCVGQKQRWYLVRLKGEDDVINLKASGEPEFDDWRWIDFWQAPDEVVHFKSRVYQQALEELSYFVPHLETKQTLLKPVSVVIERPDGKIEVRRKAPSFANRYKNNTDD